MNGMPKIIKTLTVSGTAIGVVVIIAGNALIASSRGGSSVGVALRTLGLLSALGALGTFLGVSVGSRIMRRTTRRMALANQERQRLARETVMNQNLSPFQHPQPTPALVTLGRSGAFVFLGLSAITFLPACVSLVQARPGGLALLYSLAQLFTITLSLLGLALLLWIAAEALNKSAQNHWFLVRLLQQQNATGPAAATTHATSPPLVSTAQQPTPMAAHTPRDQRDNG